MRLFSHLFPADPDSLERDGYAVVRSIITKSLAAELRSLIESAFAAADEGRCADDMKAAIDATMEWGGLSFDAASHLTGGKLDSVAAEIETGAAKATRLKLRFVPQVSNLRRQTVMVNFLQWHIDADGTGSISYDPCFNVWMPLSKVGSDLPSIQLVRGSHKIMRVEPKLDAGYAVRPAEWVAERFPRAKIETPTLGLGDAVIFDHYTLHQTQPLPGRSGIRLACELRMTAR
jgi:hypothetical protein